MKKTLVLFLIIAAAAIAYFTIAKINPPVNTQPVTTIDTEVTNTQTTPPAINMEPHEPPDVTEAQLAQLAFGGSVHAPTALTFDLVAGMFYYVPNVIRVKQGDTVTINMSSAGGFHDFTQADYGLKIEMLKTGESGSVTFVADKVGSFEYYCSVGQHRQMGQTGMLIVE